MQAGQTIAFDGSDSENATHYWFDFGTPPLPTTDAIYTWTAPSTPASLTLTFGAGDDNTGADATLTIMLEIIQNQVTIAGLNPSGDEVVQRQYLEDTGLDWQVNDLNAQDQTCTATTEDILLYDGVVTGFQIYATQAKIEAGQNFVFSDTLMLKAGHSIRLMPGFSADQTCQLQAVVEDCSVVADPTTDYYYDVKL